MGQSLLHATAAPAASAAAPSSAAAAGGGASAGPSGAAYTYRCSKGDGTLNGAGSTFINPLLSKMAGDYNTLCGVQVNYQSIGSGGGVKAWQQNTVDFGASDAYLADSDMAAAAANGTPVEIPVTFGAVVVAYNLSGLSAPLKMTPDVVAGIFLGKITKWNDPALAAVNPGVNLPSTAISVVHRSDGSGTNSIFTKYLTAVSPDWVNVVGAGDPTKSAGKTVAWPLGQGASGNEGVTQGITGTDGAVGYIDVAYAIQAHYALFAIKNQAGVFVTPGLRQITATANLVTTAKPDSTGLTLNVVDPPAPSLPTFKPIKGKSASERAKILKYRASVTAKARVKNKKLEIAYPICTFTYVIVPEQANQADALKTFFQWALTKGQGSTFGPPLRFVAIPKAVQKTSLSLLSRIHS